MTTLSNHDITCWSLPDFELSLDLLYDQEQSAIAHLNQPRAASATWAATAIEADIEAIHKRQDTLLGLLRRHRYPDPREDDLRVRLLMMHELRYPGMKVPELVQMALSQSVHPAS